MRCAAITSTGERCKLDATSGSYYWSPAPENTAARKSRARRNGRGKGSGEIADLKAQLADLAKSVLDGQITAPVGTVVNQILNTRARLLEVERRIKETEELKERIVLPEQSKGEPSWCRHNAGRPDHPTGISGDEDLVNSLGAKRRGVRVGRRSATGNRVGGVKPSRGFESHPLRSSPFCR